MSYEKQSWNKYDDLKSEEENIQNGAVVTDNRMNHIEEGISDIDKVVTLHESNQANPHSVTKEQVGLGNVSNFELATEAEATDGTSNTKYMTPSLTQKAAKSYVDKTDVGLPNVDNVKQASKTEFDAHATNKSNPHEVTAAQVGVYTKSETNAKFVGYTILQANSDLNDITTNGFYSNRKETIINIPGDSTGTYFTLTAEFTSSGLNGTQIYKESVTNKVWIRSRNNTNWSQWSLVANDYEVVHITGDETIAGKKTFTDDMYVKNIEVTGDYKKSTDTEMTELPLSSVVSAKVYYRRKNGVVYIKGSGNWGSFEAKTERTVGTLPVGFHPPVEWPSGMNAMGGSQSMSAKVMADGRVGITCDIKKDGVYGGFSMNYPVE